MHWLAYMTTCPRQDPTLHRAIESLDRAGWPDVHLFSDAAKTGARATFLRACQHALTRLHGDGRLLIVQDDVVFRGGTRAWIERQLRTYPNLTARDVVSLWLPEVHQKHAGQWRAVRAADLPASAYGALAYVLGREVVQRIVSIANHDGNPNLVDQLIGFVCKNYGLRYWYPPESCCQHVSQYSAVSGLHWDSEFRRAACDTERPMPSE